VFILYGWGPSVLVVGVVMGFMVCVNDFMYMMWGGIFLYFWCCILFYDLCLYYLLWFYVVV